MMPSERSTTPALANQFCPTRSSNSSSFASSETASGSAAASGCCSAASSTFMAASSLDTLCSSLVMSSASSLSLYGAVFWGIVLPLKCTFRGVDLESPASSGTSYPVDNRITIVNGQRRQLLKSSAQLRPRKSRIFHHQRQQEPLETIRPMIPDS